VNTQFTRQAPTAAVLSQTQSYIQKAESFVNYASPDSWRSRDDAFQRETLRGLRTEMAGLIRASGHAFGVHQARKLLKLLTDAASHNVAREFERSAAVQVNSAIISIQLHAGNDFRDWSALGRSRRAFMLRNWHHLLDDLMLEGSNDVYQLLEQVRVMEDKTFLLGQKERAAEIWAEEEEAAEMVRVQQEVLRAINRFPVLDWAQFYYENRPQWSVLDWKHQGVFLRTLQTKMRGSEEKDRADSLRIVLLQRSLATMLKPKHDSSDAGDTEGVPKEGVRQVLYWPDSSYQQPENSLSININIQYCKHSRQSRRRILTSIPVDILQNWDRHEAERRFNHAYNNPRLDWNHLPVEAALLLPLPRLEWPKLPKEDLKEEELDDDKQPSDQDEADTNSEANEEQNPTVEKKRKGPAPHESSRSDVPFLPNLYPFYIKEMASNWSELKEFLSYLYGVDEGEMAERVDKAGALKDRDWNAIRNTIRKRIAYKRLKQRILDPDTVVTRKEAATEIASQIVDGWKDGKTVVPKLTDEQLLFVSNLFAFVVCR
jgi:hypothetical protein